MQQADPTSGGQGFPAYDVVALVASAGGMTALSTVLKALPADFPVAIVIVQHLDPRHRSLISDILGRRTKLPVREASEGDKLEPARCGLPRRTAISWSTPTAPCH